jgi:hypothetical protein
MSTRTQRLVFSTGVLGLAVLGFAQLRSEGQTKKTPEESKRVKPIPVEAGSLKKDVRPFMLAKLTNSQRVFEGLVMRDFAKIKQGADSLKMTSLAEPSAPSGDSKDDEVFDHFRTEFLRLAFKLEQMADAKNLEGSAYVAEKLNGTCIACHQYLRDEFAEKQDKQKTDADKPKK